LYTRLPYLSTISANASPFPARQAWTISWSVRSHAARAGAAFGSSWLPAISVAGFSPVL
jgi:hypothetical protein